MIFEYVFSFCTHIFNLFSAQPPGDQKANDDFLAPTCPITTLTNGQPQENNSGDEELKNTPFITPEIARRYPTKIPQATSTPKKGILKHTVSCFGDRGLQFDLN